MAANGDLHAATDGLSVIIRHLADFENCGLVLDGDGVAELSLQLKAIRRIVQRLENEVSAARWNRLGEPDADAPLARMQGLMRALEAQGSNVRLFPVVPRPRPQDGGTAA